MRVEFGSEWARAVAALRIADKRFPHEFDATLRANALEAINRSRRRIMSMPTKGAKHSGLRARVARGVGLQHRGVGRYRVTTAMPPGQQIIPRGIESQWRHPVFGRGSVIQAPNWNWFTDSMQDQRSEIVKDLHDDLEDMADFIDKMTNGR